LKVESLNTEIKKITLGNLMSNFFDSTVEQVSDGIAYMKDIVVGTLKVGSPEKRTGITLYDEETGDAYCLSISNGETKTTIGECPIIEVPDICPNIEEYQSEVPEDFELNEDNECVESVVDEGTVVTLSKDAIVIKTPEQIEAQRLLDIEKEKEESLMLETIRLEEERLAEIERKRLSEEAQALKLEEERLANIKAQEEADRLEAERLEAEKLAQEKTE